MSVSRYVLFYESADDVASKAPPHFPAHWARCEEFHERGLLTMVGTFADPQSEGSMAIFTTREGAVEFAERDPFVLNGVVRHWELREWNEAFGQP
ncbi:MAG: YciI family protein [Thermoleophilaceae bacterium]